MTGDVCVVMPTIREFEACRSYVRNARSNGFDPERLWFVLVTEDHCDVDAMEGMLDELGVGGEVFDGSRRDRWFAYHDLGQYRHVVPARSHAQTSFGLLYLWANEFEYGVFLDDDTRPHPDSDFFGQHLANLHYEGPIESVSSDEQWVNVLYQSIDDHGLYPRGYPFSAMGETIDTEVRRAEDVVVSQGLWTDVPDLDAVRILLDGNLEGLAETRLDTDHYDGNFIAAPGQYLTVCSMNLAFHREVVPAFYQLPMDDNPWSIGRFDDIWSGVFLKRACDLLGKEIVSGRPLCIHEKAPRSTFSDLANEAPALALNEQLWRVVDAVDIDPSSFAAAYAAMARTLADRSFDLQNGEFLNYVGEHMLDWLDCLAELDRTGPGVGTEVSADV